MLVFLLSWYIFKKYHYTIYIDIIKSWAKDVKQNKTKGEQKYKKKKIFKSNVLINYRAIFAKFQILIIKKLNLYLNKW